jgi:hypothetical protein
MSICVGMLVLIQQAPYIRPHNVYLQVQETRNNIHLMYALEGNSEFCFPECFSRENKIHYFPREHTLSALLYSDETNINIEQHSYNNICIS